MATGKKPTAAFVLLLTGGIIALLTALFIVWVGNTLNNEVSTYNASAYNASLTLTDVAVLRFSPNFMVGGILGLIFATLMIVSSVKLFSINAASVKKWSKVGMISTILGGMALVLSGVGAYSTVITLSNYGVGGAGLGVSWVGIFSAVIGIILGLVGSMLGLAYSEGRDAECNAKKYGSAALGNVIPVK